jgi:hypothetical protein
MIAWLRDVLLRVWWWARVRWVQWRMGGALRIQPRLRTVTYRRYERACLLLGLDPQKVREGTQDIEDADLGDVYETGEELAELVCRNHRWVAYVMRQSERPIAEAILAHVLADFFLRSLARWAEQKASYATTQSGAPSSAISRGKAAARRLSAARLRGSTPETMSGS